MSDDMKWATESLEYLFKTRRTAQEDFNLTMKEIHEHGKSREDWFLACKNLFPLVYHHSAEFTGDRNIPGTEYASPSQFAEKLMSYKAFVQQAADDLDKAEKQFEKKHGKGGTPDLIYHIRNRITSLSYAIDHVVHLRPVQMAVVEATNGDIDLLLQLAKRFHEAVVALRKHPRSKDPFQIENEWDCQYLFRSILAVYFQDVRPEEWNPSVAGSSARCDFFLKPLAVMVELKWVRGPNDQIRIKKELLSDLGDYGGNQQVDCVLSLIYDPGHHLETPTALQKDLSGPTKGLKDVWVIVSPPR